MRIHNRTVILNSQDFYMLGHTLWFFIGRLANGSIVFLQSSLGPPDSMPTRFCKRAPPMESQRPNIFRLSMPQRLMCFLKEEKRLEKLKVVSDSMLFFIGEVSRSTPLNCILEGQKHTFLEGQFVEYIVRHLHCMCARAHTLVYGHVCCV